MKHLNIKLVVLLLGMSITAQAQQATTTSGGDASGGGGTVAYSIGQVAYITDASGKVNQGVQQAYEISTVSIEEANLSISLSVFPNPTTDKLTLVISDFKNEELYYQFIDIQGKIIMEDYISSFPTQIEIHDLSTSTYFLNIINKQNQPIQLFKIIKN